MTRSRPPLSGHTPLNRAPPNSTRKAGLWKQRTAEAERHCRAAEEHAERLTEDFKSYNAKLTDARNLAREHATDCEREKRRAEEAEGLNDWYKNKLKSAKCDAQAAKSKLAEAEQSLQQEKKRANQAEKDADALNKDLERSRNARASLEKEVSSLKQTIRSRDDRNRTTEKRNSVAIRQIKRLKREIHPEIFTQIMQHAEHEQSKIVYEHQSLISSSATNITQISTSQNARSGQGEEEEPWINRAFNIVAAGFVVLLTLFFAAVAFNFVQPDTLRHAFTCRRDQKSRRRATHEGSIDGKRGQARRSYRKKQAIAGRDGCVRGFSFDTAEQDKRT